MRIRSVGHACLEIEANGLRIVTDPWWEGPAYTNQWFPWPTPQPAGLEQRTVDYVYLSHGHEDHLHVPTLKTLRPGATALVPELVAGGFGSYLRDELGFAHVIELPHGKPVRLRRGLVATCYVNMTDSLLVLEDGDRVLVNANDALHSSPPAVIDHLCATLRRNHPPVDTLFVGFAGASWWPNCLRVPGKDDRAVARERESYFTDNFLRVVDALSPRVASAYAASFTLLEPHNRWIDELRFDLPTPDEEYRRRRPHGPSKAHLLLPGDVIEETEIVQGTTPRPSRATFERALGEELRGAVDQVTNLKPLSSDALRQLAERLDQRLRSASTTLPPHVPFTLEIHIRENPETALHVVLEPTGARAGIGAPRTGGPSLSMRAEILEAVLAQDYGIESVLIGYGAVATLDELGQYERIVEVLRMLSPRRGGVRAVVRELRQQPLRSLAALWRQRWPLALNVAARTGLLGSGYRLRPLEQGKNVDGERPVAA